MATENRIAYIQWIIEAIKILCDKSPIQNCLSERTRDRVGMKMSMKKANGRYSVRFFVREYWWDNYDSITFFRIRPSPVFHSVNPFALRPITMSAAEEGLLKTEAFTNICRVKRLKRKRDVFAFEPCLTPLQLFCGTGERRQFFRLLS